VVACSLPFSLLIIKHTYMALSLAFEQRIDCIIP
jgi:hypothetical protein